jgi:hypothetical protein
VSLPWATGNPYALYAHVRAVTREGPAAWEQTVRIQHAVVGRPGSADSRLSRIAALEQGPRRERLQGLARRTGHWFTTRSNMADEREYYAFHQNATWTGAVHWRVGRCAGSTARPTTASPVVSYGPWSPVYTSYNPPFSTGPLTAQATVLERRL